MASVAASARLKVDVAASLGLREREWVREGTHSVVPACFVLLWFSFHTEMEYLDINLTEDSSLLLHAIRSLIHWRIFRKNRTLLWFLKQNKKSLKQENSRLFMNSILWNKIKRVENQTKTQVWEDSGLCPETWTKTAVQEFHLRTALTPAVLVYGVYKYFFETALQIFAD